MIQEAAKLLNVKERTLIEFDELDSYNNNQIKGCLCREATHNYGAIIMFEVNGKKVEPQVIYCTPKLHYPFGTDDNGERHYNFPKISRVLVYEKKDGTNICGYSYKDSEGKIYISYKTRLTPTLRKSKFGDFKSMWDEIIEEYPEEIAEVDHILKTRNMTVSFEMYGYRNPILIKYKESLDARVLFFVDQENYEITPASLWTSKPFFLQAQEGFADSDKIIDFYNQKREEAQAQNKESEDGIDGIEGYIFYCLTEDNKWEMLKCKPEMVETLHWVNDSIPLNIITTTIWNSLESCDEITFDYLVELLKEEFTDTQIGKSEQRIRKAIDSVKREQKIRIKVLEVYQSSGLDFEKDGKKMIMRCMSEHFDKHIMSKVFGVLKVLNIIKEQGE